MEELGVTELAARRGGADAPLVLDVREDWERAVAALPDTVDIPMAQVPQRLDDLRGAADGRDLVVMCRSGGRSAQVATYLNQNGFQRVYNLRGGILAWSDEVDPSVAKY